MITVDIDIWKKRSSGDKPRSTGGRDAPTDVLGASFRRRLTRDGVARAYVPQSIATNSGENAGAQGQRSAAFGGLAEAVDEGTAALGTNAKARVKDSTVVGDEASATAYGSTVVGRKSGSRNRGNIIVGRGSGSGFVEAVIIANETFATFDGQIQVGQTIFHGAGSPEGVQVANPGSIYLSTDGEFWIKETGTGATGWVECCDSAALEARVLALEEARLLDAQCCSWYAIYKSGRASAGNYGCEIR